MIFASLSDIVTTIIPKDLFSNMALSWQPIRSVDDITQAQWQQLSDHDSQFSTPFLSYQFLKGLEKTQCVDGKTGWHSYHIGIFSDHFSDQSSDKSSDHTEDRTADRTADHTFDHSSNYTGLPEADVVCLDAAAIENQNKTQSNELPQADKQLIGFMPCYLKTHSYGEYVFDHAWANAYQQHQIPYYPKLVACIPFTPVTGSRLLIKQSGDYSFQQINEFIALNIDAILIQASASSFHCLFLPKSQSDVFAKNQLAQHQPTRNQLLQRLSVQFVWQNRDYSNFDDFMQQMTSRKRRSIRKERAGALVFPIDRNQSASAYKQTHNENSDNKNSDKESRNKEVQHVEPIKINRLAGDKISKEVMADFYLCYQQTYLKRSGHMGYLNEAFFDYLLREMRSNIMIVMAYHSDACIASALFLYNEEQLFGRYWGALQEVSGLHFECCYYQGIEFAIEKNLRQFNPGTQGEHKILRGFEPTLCYSNHYLQHPDFQAAVANFLKHESDGVQQYKQQAESVLPFKQN